MEFSYDFIQLNIALREYISPVFYHPLMKLERPPHLLFSTNIQLLEENYKVNVMKEDFFFGQR